MKRGKGSSVELLLTAFWRGRCSLNRSGTGERASAEGDSTLEENADIEPDRVESFLDADDDAPPEPPAI